MRPLLFAAVAAVAGLLEPTSALGQTGSITIRSLTITPEGDEFRSFAGQPQVFEPGASNILLVNPPPSFGRRTAKVTAVLDYSFSLSSGTTAIVACGFEASGLEGRATSFAARVNEGESAASVTGFVGEGEMELAEGIDRTYSFTCRVQNAALSAVLAEAPIEIAQRYRPVDVLRILSVDPPTSEPLAGGTTQTFTAEVEYSLDAIRLGTQLMLVATGGGGELVERDEQRRNNSAQSTSRTGPATETRTLTLTDVPVPEDGAVQLYAEQVNFRQFGDFASAAFQTYNVSPPVIYGEPAGVDFSIRHIEVNQAVQDGDNALPLVADKPTVVRVVVRTPKLPGDARVAPVLTTVTFRRDGLERSAAGIGLPYLPPDDQDVFEARMENLSASVPVPREMLGPGVMEIEATVNLINGEPQISESKTDNNSAAVTAEFEERDVLAIGFVAPPNFSEPFRAETIGTLFPLSPTRGLAYIPDAIYTTDGDDRDDVDTGTARRVLLEAAITAAGGLYDILVLWDTPGNGLDGGSLSLARAVTNGRFVRVLDDPKRSDQVALASAVARTLLRSQRLGCLSAAAGGLDAVGWDSGQSRPVRLNGYQDLLSTCGGDRWISPETYVRLFLRDFRAAPAMLTEERPAQGSGELAAVSGTVVPGAGGTLAPVVRFVGAEAPPLDSTGTHCVRGQGAAGFVEHCFTPDSAADGPIPFAFVFPAEAVSRGVQLTAGGEVLASLTPSGAPPTVAITSPGDGATIDAANPVTVSWDAADADGDPVSVALLISSDGGATFSALATGLSEGSYEADFSTIAGGDQVVLRASASDGLLTAFDEVGPLTVVQRPALSIASDVDLGQAAAGVPTTVFVPFETSGSGRLRVESIVSDNPAFEAASGVPAEFLPGFGAGFAATVTPPGPGVHTATLTLTTNAPDTPQATVRLTIEGLDPEEAILDLSEDRIEFPEVRAGETAEALLSLVNRGRTSLTYDLAVEGAGFGLGSAASIAPEGAQQNGAALGAGEQREVAVTFSPSAAGEQTGRLTITSDAPNLPTATVELFGSATEAAAGPAINAGGIVNAASFAPSLSRGAIASLFGSNLADSTEVATETPLPTLLGGTSVEIDGVPAPLFFVSPSQINFQIPFGAALSGPASASVSTPGGDSPAANVTLTPYAPGVFANPATGEPIVTRPDGTPTTAGSPAGPGDVLIVYFTGVGNLTAVPEDGEPSGVDPLSAASAPPTVTAAGEPAQVFFAGLTPGFVGLAQLNIRLPENPAATGETVTLRIEFPGGEATTVELPFAAP